MAKKIYLKQLDALRGFAALYVVLHHVQKSLHLIDSKWVTFLFSFGQEAVMIFFMLSGFVIYLSCANKSDLTFKKYFYKRFIRIYFPLLITFILSALIYHFNGNLKQSFSLPTLIGNLLMAQDTSLKPGLFCSTFLGNTSLWSLSYEWWFYMLFFPIFKYGFKRQYNIYCICAISSISYLTYIFIPNKISLTLTYFIIWWCGVEIAKLFINNKEINFNSIKPIIYCLIFMSAMTVIPVFKAESLRFGTYPFLIFRHFCFALFLFFAGLWWQKRNYAYFKQIIGKFSSLAPISYALYIFHFPILIQWQLDEYIHNSLIIYFLKLILLFGLSYIVEVKLQPLINRLFFTKFSI